MTPSVRSCLSIAVASGTPAELRMQQLLSSLPEKYDLHGWIYTTNIQVDEGALPHSHPVLTLSAAHDRNETMALAELIHEQLHWFEEENAERRDRAIEETKHLYPTVPVARPEGAGSETSTRLHLLVCYLEYQALKSLLGDSKARQTVMELSRSHYYWVYETVLREEARIADIVWRYDLVPEPLRRAERRPS